MNSLELMITKNDIPFDLLSLVEPLAQANLDLIQLKKEENTYYSFVEVDPRSKNFFKIFIDSTKVKLKNERGKYTIKMKPSNSSISTARIHSVNLADLKRLFQNWLKLIRDIHETPSVHDDNFVRQYAEFYFEEFKILDADANISPFDPRQQDLVEAYLISLATAIKQSGEKLPEPLKLELLNEIEDIKESLTTATKNLVMKGITKIFGKLYKISRSLTKDIVKEAKSRLIQKLIEAGIEYTPKLIEMIFNQ